VSYRVRTDIGTDSRPRPIHCRLNRCGLFLLSCRSLLVQQYW